MAPLPSTLVIAAVGDASQHPTWLAGRPERSYDVALIYYGNRPNNVTSRGEYFAHQRGRKFQLIGDFLDRQSELESRYDYFWMPDDDIACCPEDIIRLVRYMHEYRLAIAQPAIGRGEVAFQALRQQTGWRLRYTGFAEVMCPIISREALDLIRHTFRGTGSARGIDWDWSELVDHRRIAVIDDVTVHHTRPLRSGDVSLKFEAHGVNPSDALRIITRKNRLNGVTKRSDRKRIRQETSRMIGVDQLGRFKSTGPQGWNPLSRAA